MRYVHRTPLSAGWRRGRSPPAQRWEHRQDLPGDGLQLRALPLVRVDGRVTHVIYGGPLFDLEARCHRCC